MMRAMQQKRWWAVLLAGTVLLVLCVMMPQAPRYGSLAWFIANVAADEENALRDAMASMDYDWAHDPHGRGPSLDMGDARIDGLFGVPYSKVFFLVKPEPCFPAAFVMEQFPDLERRSDKWMQAFIDVQCHGAHRGVGSDLRQGDRGLDTHALTGGRAGRYTAGWRGLYPAYHPLKSIACEGFLIPFNP